MATAAHKITSKGQVTIPIEILREANLKAGDRVVFSRQGKQIILVSENDLLDQLYGIFSANAPKTKNDAESIAREKEIIAAGWAAGGDEPSIEETDDSK